MSSEPEKANVIGNKQPESKSNMNINSELPWHIISLIFSKLSISNWVACRLVCKTWNHLILDFGSSSRLVPKTFFVGINNGTRPLKTSKSWEQHSFEIHSFNFDAKCLEARSRGSFKFDSDWFNLKIINACNGLLCINFYRPKHGSTCIGILNPATNEYIQLLRDESETYVYTYGFGLSSKTKRYKVVRLYSACTRDYNSMVEIFTFGGSHNKWSFLDSQPFRICKPINEVFLRTWKSVEDGVYLNGSLYWSGIDSTMKDNVICRMDVEDEKFELIPLPIDNFSNEAIWASNNNIYVTLKERVCNKFQVWMMQSNNGGENSWIRKFVGDGIRVDWGRTWTRPMEHLQLIKVYEDGEMLFLVYGFHLFLYNPKTRKLKTHYDYRVDSIRTSWVYQIESLNFDSLDKIFRGD